MSHTDSYPSSSTDSASKDTVREPWDSWRQRINTHLEQIVLDIRRDAPEGLSDAMAYCILAPGKRLRPLLTLAACEAVGGNAEVAVPAGCAVELVHTYSLVHDDLPAMDDDDLRRGQPTCHRKFGEAMAILVGDALQALAFEQLAGAYPPAIAAPACLALARAAGAAGMVGGQVLDLESENCQGSLKALDRLHSCKTGELFRVCMRLGCLAAQASEGRPVPERTVESLDSFGAKLGLAFQIIDDLLDVEGSDAEMGKRVGKDAVRGKMTYPGVLGVETSRAMAAELYREAEKLLAPFKERKERLLTLFALILNRKN